MRVPTAEQQTVLNDNARIRVVRASPGSGKTTLVGMLIRKELENWPGTGGGIAALSFTRVGGQEIRKELGYDIDFPHVVGTIDAFIFRYIVRPFLQKAHPDWAAPRLIPADWSPNQWSKARGGAPWIYRGAGGRQAESYNLFDVCFIGEDEDEVVIAYPRPFLGGVTRVGANDRAGLFQAKSESWRRYGWLTHSDASLVACSLLSDAQFGATIRSLVLRRFPLLIVDELQDTGFFLGKSVQILLGEASARAVLVGDPNQAIYEFNGARPQLFAAFEAIRGASRLPLGQSQRCQASIVAVATHLKESEDPFESAAQNNGRAFLVRYADMAIDVARIASCVRHRQPVAVSKVVARQSKIVEVLTSRSAKEAKSLHCPALNHMHRAVLEFRQGHNARGLANARAALDLAVLGYEGVTDDELQGHGIDSNQWKALAVSCLLTCNSLATNCTFYEWQTAAGGVLDEVVAALVLPAALPYEAGRLRPTRHVGYDVLCSRLLPLGPGVGNALAGIPVQTVHSVKGETHDVTMFVCPKPPRLDRCPSVVWWSANPEDHEERRIAYVAMTRTRGDLIVCVSEDCYQRLRDSQAAFAGAFQCMTVDEFIAAF